MKTVVGIVVTGTEVVKMDGDTEFKAEQSLGHVARDSVESQIPSPQNFRLLVEGEADGEPPEVAADVIGRVIPLVT